jgi:hypothetical protein
MNFIKVALFALLFNCIACQYETPFDDNSKKSDDYFDAFISDTMHIAQVAKGVKNETFNNVSFYRIGRF